MKLYIMNFRLVFLVSFFCISGCHADVITDRYSQSIPFGAERRFSASTTEVPNNWQRNWRHRAIDYYLNDGYAGAEILRTYTRRWSSN